MENTWEQLIASDKVFYYFAEISKVPRASGNEKQISDYLVAFAKERGLYVRQDKLNNVVIKKPATSGYENAPVVIIQGHIDMVCEKNEGTVHDFAQDPLKLIVDGDCLKADGTTLGADNGIAVAFSLALLDAKDIPHPALEIVMTTDEEVGLTGALEMDASDLQGQYFINLDSEEEGELVISCAGGLRAMIHLPITEQTIDPKEYTYFQFFVKGLKGGHSGMEIDKNRANATMVLGRILATTKETVDFKIKDIHGGMKDNVIPRESSVDVYVKNSDVDAFLKEMDTVLKTLQVEFKTSDPGLILTQTKMEITCNVCFSDACTSDLLFLLMTMPNGVQSMSAEIAGLVESSLNLGCLAVKEKEIEFQFATRSSVRSKKYFMTKQLAQLAAKCGATCVETKKYPEWPVKTDSKLIDICKAVYEKQYGKQALVKGIHAGLEAGVFLEKMPHLDAISFGPNIYDVHSPDEWISITSTKRTWDYLKEVLKSIQ